jgi:hypothetical protein
LTILAVVLAANLPYLVGGFDPNPLPLRSNLISSGSPGLIGGVSTIDPNNGSVSQALGHRAALDWLHGSPPWWDPYEGVGSALAGEMQSAALFPPTLLLAVPNGQLFEHILLEMLAGLGTFLLLRRIGLTPWPSCAGAVVFAVNGTFAWLTHAPVNPVAFLPLLLLGVEHAFSAARYARPGGWSLIAVSLALSIYAGFPEGAYIDGLLGCAWALWRMTACNRSQLIALVRKLLAGLTIGLLLAAPIIVAFIDFLAHANVGDHAAGLGSIHLPAVALPQLLMPYIYGPLFGLNDPHSMLQTIWGWVGGYLTPSVVVLALIGLLSPGHRGLRITLGLWLLLALTHMFGGPLGIDRLIWLAPGMDHVSFYRYADPSVELAMAILAALGLEHIVVRPERRHIALAATITLMLIAAAAVAARPLVSQLSGSETAEVWFRYALLGAVAVILATVGCSRLKHPQQRLAALCAVLALDVVVMFMVPEFAAPRDVRADYSPALFLQRHLGLGRFFTLGPIQPNYGAYFAISSINDNDLPIPAPWTRFVRHRLDPYVEALVFTGDEAARSVTAPSTETELFSHLSGYRAAAVRYVVAPPGQSLPPTRGTFRLVFKSRTASIYKLAGAASYFSTSAPGCTVSPSGRQVVHLFCPAPTTLVRREEFMPGWTAQVDGREAPVHEYQGLFQAVRVPAGRSSVSFSFEPPGTRWFVLAFGVGALLLGAGSLSAHRARRLPHAEARSAA